MFVVADIFARYKRSKGYEVFFPIASHYSGNTAHKIASEFSQIFKSNDQNLSNNKVWNLYKNFYSTPELILRTFTDPLAILDFYTQEILWELRSLDVSGNYEAFYTTHQDDFNLFIQSLISRYKKKGLLANNTKGELALDYDNGEWKEKTNKYLESIRFEQKFHKNNILGVLKNNNLRNDWSFLRTDGIGAKYKEQWIIDPMFDSELFTIFDLYAKFSEELHIEPTIKTFNHLFDVLEEQRKPETDLEKKICDWLPCDQFICEEHLKNWILKKIYAENALLSTNKRSNNYFILGMGMLNGKRMSASRGNAILASDLVTEYGSTKARLILLMQGGHPSKVYDYNFSVTTDIDKILKNFTNFYLHLLMIAKSNPDQGQQSMFTHLEEKLDSSIQSGYFRQAILDLLVVIPKNFKGGIVSHQANQLVQLYINYLGILVPSLLKDFEKVT